MLSIKINELDILEELNQEEIFTIIGGDCFYESLKYSPGSLISLSFGDFRAILRCEGDTWRVVG